MYNVGCTSIKLTTDMDINNWSIYKQIYNRHVKSLSPLFRSQAKTPTPRKPYRYIFSPYLKHLHWCTKNLQATVQAKPRQLEGRSSNWTQPNPTEPRQSEAHDKQPQRPQQKTATCTKYKANFSKDLHNNKTKKVSSLTKSELLTLKSLQITSSNCTCTFKDRYNHWEGQYQQLQPRISTNNVEPLMPDAKRQNQWAGLLEKRAGCQDATVGDGRQKFKARAGR